MFKEKNKAVNSNKKDNPCDLLKDLLFNPEDEIRKNTDESTIELEIVIAKVMLKEFHYSSKATADYTSSINRKYSHENEIVIHAINRKFYFIIKWIF